MNRLFRQPHQRRIDYAALTLFAIVYLCAMTLVLAPGTVVSDRAGATSEVATKP